MNKPLPASLQPTPVPTDPAVAGDEAITALRAAIAKNHGWIVAVVEPDGTTTSVGVASAADSHILALAALRAWADAAALEGQNAPGKLFDMVMAMTGARSQYVSGGTVEQRR